MATGSASQKLLMPQGGSTACFPELPKLSLAASQAWISRQNLKSSLFRHKPVQLRSGQPIKSSHQVRSSSQVIKSSHQVRSSGQASLIAKTKLFSDNQSRWSPSVKW
jgi:hypothetical protein